MKTSYKSAVCILFRMCCIAGVCCAQTSETTIRLEPVDFPSGISFLHVTYLYEDSRGFLWIGAYTGLYRYDGYEVLHYQHFPDDSNSISDNKINRILENSDGNFWIGTQQGLNFFDSKKQRFKRYSELSGSGIGKVEIFDLELDRYGALWVAAGDGLYRQKPGMEQFARQNYAGQSKTAPIYAIVQDSTGVYFVENGMLFYLPYGGEIRQIPVDGPIRGMYAGTVSAQQRPLSSLWIETAKGLFSLDRGKGQMTEIAGLRGMKIASMTAMSDHWLVCTRNGIYRLNPATYEATGPLFAQVNGSRQSTAGIGFCMKGSRGIAWFRAGRDNLYKSDALKERFRHAPLDLTASMIFPVKMCELFEYSPGVLLLPGVEGPRLFDLHSGQESAFSYKPDYNFNGWDSGLTCFFEETTGMIWIGTAGGLFLFDKNNRRFVPLERQFGALKQLQGIAIRKIHRDRNGRLWLATWDKGLFKIDLRRQTLRQYNKSPQHTSQLLESGRSILETRKGDLWFGTRDGLLKYLEAQDSFRVYRNIPGDPTSMSENTAFCLYEDEAGNIWSGSYGGGLNCLDVKTGRFKHYTTRDGLLNNNVFGILPDKGNNLWLYGVNGISRLSLSTKTFQTFTREQGLLNTTFDGFLYGKSRFSNILFFGGRDGVDYFDPDSITTASGVPAVWFTGFSLNNEPVPIGDPDKDQNRFVLPLDIGHATEINLRYDQNVIGFNFAAPDFSAPNTIQYAYRLVGFDTAWQYIGDKRSVTFTNLDPGTYTLKVKASNGDGIWDPAESNVRAISITVAPPWWRTWYFRLFVALALAGLVTAFYRYRIRQIRERESIKTALNQRIAQIKMEALRSQMNPHFVFNCLSSLKLFVEKNETEKASDHISKFATLLRRVLDDARTETETVALERELDTLRRYVELEMIRFKEKFDFQLDISPDVDLQNIEIPPLILQPFVENAILHGLQHKTGAKGLLLMRVVEENNQLKIEIEDNGIGREAANAIKAANPVTRQSHGLNVTAERLDYFSQKNYMQSAVETTDLLDAHGRPAGTRVTLSFQTNGS